MVISVLILLHKEWSKHHRILTILSEIGLIWTDNQWIQFYPSYRKAFSIKELPNWGRLIFWENMPHCQCWPSESVKHIKT